MVPAAVPARPVCSLVPLQGRASPTPRGLVVALAGAVLALAGCDTGGDTPVLPDADLSKPMCTGVVYDSCLEAGDCASSNCKLFEDTLIQICTQTCDASTPCPMDAVGAAAKCNNRGICKPTVANACHP